MVDVQSGVLVWQTTNESHMNIKMGETGGKVLVLALGNDIMGDDAIGLLAARSLRECLSSEVDVVEMPVAGFALLDYLHGYQRALIIDSISTGESTPGSIRELSLSDLPEDSFSSPHYAGLNEVVALARELDITFPQEIRILVMEVNDPFVLREGLSRDIQRRLPAFVKKAEKILTAWGCVLIARYVNEFVSEPFNND
jgi:hydrogenase maturation protease